VKLKPFFMAKITTVVTLEKHVSIGKLPFHLTKLKFSQTTYVEALTPFLHTYTYRLSQKAMDKS
jgi:hypothetical protein